MTFSLSFLHVSDVAMAVESRWATEGCTDWEVEGSEKPVLIILQKGPRVQEKGRRRALPEDRPVCRQPHSAPLPSTRAGVV